MGPWFHGGWRAATATRSATCTFDAKTADFYREQIEFPFFEYHLKGKGDPKLPEAWVFETGTNQWRKYDAWPPKDGQAAVALLPRRRQARLRRAGRRAAATAFDEYVSDPAKPVPYIDKIGDRHDDAST